MNRRPPFPRRARCAGLSLPELLTVITVLGVLAGLAIDSYSGVQFTAREGVARDRLALINRAVLHFSQANWELVRPAQAGVDTDELEILRTLQWRSAELPGSPFLPGTFGDATSSDRDDFRLQWNGRMFELLAPGTAGTGLQADGADVITVSTYTHPADFQPVGPTL